MAEMTSSVFHKLCTHVKSDEAKCDKANPRKTLSVNMQTPFIPYKRCVLEELPEEIRPSKTEFPASSSAYKGIIEPFEDQSEDNSSTEVSTTN